ncbi:MAG: hypothetical protein DRJ96_08845 [Thermoprotei archaeon]|nr:hypothetical protein [Thermoproteales archaeon]RLE88171.1 MAG: hypothetical protein DRJ67_02810 [Thermoprotei archaeon]RLE95260.1 MAG: hypothetical protein DRJ96_08845 [Thermoprotei archaeon]
MRSAVLSVRIRRDLREKMREFKEVDWRREIEEFIERRVKELELARTLEAVERVLRGVPESSEPAWKSIREFREEGWRS